MNKFRILVVSVFIAVAYPANAQEDEPTEVAAQFDCASCHTDRLREFRRRREVALVEHIPKPHLETGTQPEVSSPDMCFSCHDGFVMDSRSLWLEPHLAHPIGMPPSSKIEIPTFNGEYVFPLNEDGNVYCGTCHSAHFHEAAETAAPTFMRVDLESGNLCLACHAYQAGIEQTGHAPRRRRRGPVAHDYEAGGLCTRCHVAHEAKGPLMWAREPGEGNVTVSTLCNSCHEGQVSPSQHPSTVVAWEQEVRMHAVTDTGAAMPVFDALGRQAPAGVIGCPTCHNAHQQGDESAPLAGYFLRRTHTQGFLCADCHGPSSLLRYQYFHSSRSRPHGVEQP